MVKTFISKQYHITTTKIISLILISYQVQNCKLNLLYDSKLFSLGNDNHSLVVPLQLKIKIHLLTALSARILTT